MYGKYVNIGNKRIWVWGNPSWTNKKWLEVAREVCLQELDKDYQETLKEIGE